LGAYRVACRAQYHREARPCHRSRRPWSNPRALQSLSQPDHCGHAQAFGLSHGAREALAGAQCCVCAVSVSPAECPQGAGLADTPAGSPAVGGECHAPQAAHPARDSASTPGGPVRPVDYPTDGPGVGGGASRSAGGPGRASPCRQRSRGGGCPRLASGHGFRPSRVSGHVMAARRLWRLPQRILRWGAAEEKRHQGIAASPRSRQRAAQYDRPSQQRASVGAPGCGRPWPYAEWQSGSPLPDRGRSPAGQAMHRKVCRRHKGQSNNAWERTQRVSAAAAWSWQGGNPEARDDMASVGPHTGASTRSRYGHSRRGDVAACVRSESSPTFE
jgi:hypothetical protein